MVLVDAFAGAGGNTIAFARSGRWKRVYAIEKNPAVLQCAKHNAKIYGVEDKITWFEGDSLQIVNNQLKDLGPYSVLFASPPWGGMFLIPPACQCFPRCLHIYRTWVSLRQGIQSAHNGTLFLGYIIRRICFVYGAYGPLSSSDIEREAAREISQGWRKSNSDALLYGRR